jgi:two-component system LytT family response regulator
MKIKCIAIDDEHPALVKLEQYITRIKYLELVKTFDNAIDVLGFLKTNAIDLIFLDIEMEGLSGIELLKILQNKPKVILTTAYDQYALEAFDLDVVDYLLKPFEFERFISATERAYNAIDKPIEQDSLKPTEAIKKDNFFFVKTEYSATRINFDDILYIEGLKEYLSIYLSSGERIITLQSFASIMEKLPKDNFLRIHRSYIISIQHIDVVERNTVIMGEKRIPVSKTYKKDLAKIIDFKT